METISGRELLKFKRTDPYKILDDAKIQFSQLSNEKLHHLRQSIPEHSDSYFLYSRMENLYSSVKISLIRHQEYLNSHQDTDFSPQEIAQHNERIDKIFLNLVFLGIEFDKCPPKPVLPPPDPLIKITGIIEEVEFTKAVARFDAMAYSTVREEAKRKKENDSAAMAVARFVLDFQPPDGKSKTQECLYVKGKISGRSFSGWFGMTNIRPGDYVEMAVMPDGDDNLAYAIVTPKIRTILFTPGCNSSGKGCTLLNHMLVSFAFVMLPFLPFFIFADGLTDWVSFWYFLFSITFGIYCYTSEIRERGESFKLFNRIITALGSFNVKNIQREYSRRKKAEGWPPRIERERPMPQNGSGYVNEYFNYY